MRWSVLTESGARRWGHLSTKTRHSPCWSFQTTSSRPRSWKGVGTVGSKSSIKEIGYQWSLHTKASPLVSSSSFLSSPPSVRSTASMPRLGSGSPLLDVSGSTGGRGGAMVATMAPIFCFVFNPCCLLLVCRVSLLLCGFRTKEELVDACLIATWTAEFFGLSEGEEECPRRSEEAGVAAAHRAAMVTSFFVRILSFFSLEDCFPIPKGSMHVCIYVCMYVYENSCLMSVGKSLQTFQSNPLLHYSQSPIPRMHHWISAGSKIQEEKPAYITLTLLPAHRTVSTSLLACLLVNNSVEVLPTPHHYFWWWPTANLQMDSKTTIYIHHHLGLS